MAIKWTLPFMSVGGTSYSVNIYDSSYSGTPLELTGDVTPFETAYDIADDPLVPVRISTGNINIINTGTKSEDSIMPTAPKDRLVTLTSNNVTLWQGYIRQEEFTQPWDRAPYQLSFPIMSALGILKGQEIAYSDISGLTRMAEFMRMALSQTGATYNRIIFPDELAATSSSTLDVIFRIGLQKRNWFTYKNENVLNKTESRYEGVTWLGFLESIMGAFGYTLMEKGTDIIILSRTAETYKYITLANLTTLANNGSVTLNSVTRSTINISTLQIANTNGRKSVRLPANKGIVEGQIKKFEEDSTPQIDTKYLEFAVKLDVIRAYTGGTGYYFDKTLAMYVPVSGQSIWTFLSYADGTAQTWNSQDITRDYHIGAFARNVSGKNMLIINYNNLSGAHGYGGTYTIRVKSVTDNYFAGGSIKLSGKIGIYEGQGSTVRHHGRFMLRVGSYYYNANTDTWTTTQTVFETALDDSNSGIGAINSFNIGDGEGFYMTLPENGIYGDVELFILDPVSTSAVTGVEATYLFEDLKIEYVGPAEDLFKDYPVTDTNRFVISLNSYAQDNQEKSIDITSYINNRMGYGVALSPDLSKPLGKIYMSGEGSVYFEQCLIAAISQCYGSQREVLEIPIKQVAQFEPTDYFYWNAYFKFLANTIDWREERQIIKIFRNL